MGQAEMSCARNRGRIARLEINSFRGYIHKGRFIARSIGLGKKSSNNQNAKYGLKQVKKGE